MNHLTAASVGELRCVQHSLNKQQSNLSRSEYLLPPIRLRLKNLDCQLCYSEIIPL
jgi:hypothetical protein